MLLKKDEPIKDDLHPTTTNNGITIKHQISLTLNGNTDYQIIVPAPQNSIDKLAVKELREFLKKSTGAEFKIFTGSSKNADNLTHRIFIGLSPSAVNILGINPSADLKDQEHVVKCVGDDIFLFGKGEYGNLDAVYSFLQNQVGCRWYTAFGDMNIPRHDTFQLDSFDYKQGFAFQIRGLMNWFYTIRPTSDLFFYRNFQNQLIQQNSTIPGMKPVYNEIQPMVHTSFKYIPPQEFFTSNPEYFTMDENGNRVQDRQLCFSNHELRKKLTERAESKLKESGGKGIVSIDANDIAGSLCCCPNCKNLMKKYASPGGPIFDYLIELCKNLKSKYPEAFVKTLAYHNEQTLVPPAGIDKLPPNLIITFAPIEGNMLASLSHSSNTGTYNYLKKWCAISNHVWVWYYPNPYSSNQSVPPPPIGNLERIAEDIKMFKEAGVEGTYFEHDSGVPLSANFSDLQSWLMLKLFQNPNQDMLLLVNEFTDFYYGTAAIHMCQYITELESCRKDLLASSTLWSFNPSIGQYTYFTPKNMAKWTELFDSMEILTKNSPEQQFHVRLARMGLDAIVIANWKKFTDKYPEKKPLLAEFENRLKETDQRMLVDRMPGYKADISEWIDMANRQPKPLSHELAIVSKDLLSQVNPDFPNNLAETAKVSDPAAAWGVSNFCNTGMIPFKLGFFDDYSKINNKSKFSTISESEIKIAPDNYKFYKLGTITLTPNCYIWGGNGNIQVMLGHLYSTDEPNAKYDVYVSLKFEGPAYSLVTAGKPNRVLCDRIVLVKK